MSTFHYYAHDLHEPTCGVALRGCELAVRQTLLGDQLYVLGHMVEVGVPDEQHRIQIFRRNHLQCEYSR